MSFRSFSRFFTGKNNRTIRKARPRRAGSSVQLLYDLLEDRYAPATLPAPTVTLPPTGQLTPGELDLYAPGPGTSRPAGNSVYGPQAAMNPLDPNMIVEIHSAYYDDQNNNLDQGEMWGTVSLDKGQTWS